MSRTTFWGKGRKKRWKAVRQAVGQLAWQVAISLIGDAASDRMRRRFSGQLLRNARRSLERAEKFASRELAEHPNSAEAAIQMATIASTRGRWSDAAARWKKVLQQHPTRINRELVDLTRQAYLNNGDVADAESLACKVDGIETLFEHWCNEHDTLDQGHLAGVPTALARWPRQPLISILLMVRDHDISKLEPVVRSITAQVYRRWEMSVVVDSKDDLAVANRLKGLATEDSRIIVRSTVGEREWQSGLMGAVNRAAGECCVLLHGQSTLAPYALLFIAGELARNPSLDWLYADFDHVNERGRRHEPCFVGAPDPELALIAQHRGACAAYRTQLIREYASYPSAHWDEMTMALFMMRRCAADRIKYIPSILSHVHRNDGADGQDPAHTCSRIADAIGRFHAEAGTPTEVRALHTCQAFRVRYPLPNPAPLVSVIIPTRDALHLLRPCIESLRERTRYPEIEIIVVDNDSQDNASIQYFEDLRVNLGIQIIHAPQPFNWSKLNNLAVQQSRGSIICFLNNDVEALNDEWLAEMVSHALRPDVGAVGAALWYPDGTLQHGGIVFQPGTGAAGHAMSGQKRIAQPARARVAQSFQAVTGACMVVRKDIFLAAGGFDERALPVGYNDVDFCLRLADRLGLRCVWTPHAELLHIESASRGRLASRSDRIRHNHARRTLLNRWYERLVDDPRYPTALSTKTPLEKVYPGSPARLNRYLCPPNAKLAFIHIPKTAGVSIRGLLREIFPPPSIVSLSARSMLLCYEEDPITVAHVRDRLRDAICLIGHVSRGFGDLLQWDCGYGVVLRDPLARVISHYAHLTRQSNSPFFDEGLATAPISLLVRKGVIAGNLMLRMILGEPPERVPWNLIDTHCPHGTGFAGFRLPEALWLQQHDRLLGDEDVEPDRDVAKVERAMAIIEREFAFVGRVEALAPQLRELISAMGARASAELGRANEAPMSDVPKLTSEDQDAIERYNSLDQLLYDRIAALPGGYLLNQERLLRSSRDAHMAGLAQTQAAM